ncbi:MAG: serine/threonine-protein kinase, partial [Nannocystaceae bacterium]
MGVVYQAYDPKLQRDLALKFIRPERDADEYEIRLEREARAAAKIGHPNIVGVYDIREYRGHTYISMEYIEGETVREWVDRETRSWRDVLGVFKQAAKGIAAAHAVGVLHRDIKPSNIMVGENGRVRVLDFGIARLWSVDEIEELTASYGELTGDNRSNELAATSACLGTLAFMAPEQLIARVATEKSDQYSFCTSLWETLQGSRQGSRPRTLTLGTATLNSLARATKVRGRAIPGWVRKIIAKGLAPKPEHRHASMAELLELLESDPTRRRGLLGVVASVAVVLAGVIGGRSCAAQQATADCQADAESMAANWQEGTRKRFRNWLLATQLPYADFAAERAIPAIDEYVRNLVETRARVCEAADVEKSWDENLAERAYHCLDERRDHLVTLLELYDQQDGGDIELFVGGVPLALARLPPVANCEDYTWLHTQPVSPSDEETRSEIGAIRGLLVSASAYTRVRRGSPAIKIAEEAHRRAKKLEWAPLLALAKIRLAVALEITGEIDHSIDLLKAAYYLAVVSHADEFAVEAATCLSHLFSRRKDDFDQGLLWIELARMILLRRGEPPTSLLWSEVYGKEGVIYGLMGKRNEALRLFERQLELDRINLGSEHPWVGTDLNNLGYVYGEAGEIETAVSYWRKNLEIVETSLGPAHPQVAAVLRNLAAGEASLGNYE